MKQNITKSYIALTLLALALVGCFNTASNNRVLIPDTVTIRAEGLPLGSISNLSGKEVLVKSDKTTGAGRTLTLVQAGLGRVARWFVIAGGVMAVIGVLTAFIGHRVGLGVSVVSSGIVVIVGTLVLQAIAQAVVAIAVVLLIAGLLYEAWIHRKDAKRIVKDIADNGKLDGSTK